MAFDYGLAVSLAGNNVGTATLQNLAFTSKYPLLKVAFSGNISVTVGSAVGGTAAIASTTFSHSLGYIPMFRVFAYSNPPTNTRKAPTDFAYQTPSGASLYVHGRMGTNLLRAILANNDSTTGYTVSFFYYIFIDTGS